MSSISSLTALFYTQQTQAASSKKTQTASECAGASAQNPYGSAINISLSSAAQNILGGGSSTQQVGDVITPDPISDNAFGYNASPSANGTSTFELILATFTNNGANAAGSIGGATDASADTGTGGLQDIFKQIEDLFASLQNQLQGGNTQQTAQDDDSSQQASIDPQQLAAQPQHHHHRHHHAGAQPQDNAAAADPSATAAAGNSAGTGTGTDTAQAGTDAASILAI